MDTEHVVGKTALVTGAGSGIGRHLAQRLAVKGAYVILAGRQPVTLQQTAIEIAQAGGECLAIATDITDESSVQALISQILTTRKHLDIAVNAAGVFHGSLVDETRLDDFQSVLATNTTGTWLCLKHEIQAMKQGGNSGTIINIASNVGYHLTRPGTAAYAASKAAVRVLTQTAALEAISHHIRINSISPGPVDTLMSYRTGEDKTARDTRIAASNPSGRVARLDEIAAAALWLCSDAAACMVGHDLVIDGGASL